MKWNVTAKPLDDRLIEWIREKIEDKKKGQVIIEIKDNRVISIQYHSKESAHDKGHHFRNSKETQH